MKYLIILLISFSSYAQDCTPWMPLSKAEKIAAITSIEQLKDIPHEVCDGNKECICTDDGDLSASKIITKTAYDEETGITKEWKVLVVDAEKKAIFQAEQTAKEAALLQAQQEKEASCEVLKGLGQAIEQLESSIPSNASTVAALRAEINAKNVLSANLLKNVRGCLK